MEKLSNASQFLDLGGLDSLRSKAQNDETSALKEVAQQFEGIFVQMLMQSMRDANAVFESDSPMNSQYTKFYEQMHDQQMSLNLSGEGMLGLADLMVQQLDPANSPMTPASVLRGDINGGSKAAALTMDRPDMLQMPTSRVSSADATSAQASSFVAQPNTAKAAHVAQVTPALSHSTKTQTLDSVLSGKVLPSAAVNADKSQANFTSQDEFVARLYPHAQKAAQTLGTTPEVLIAQSALETGWGQKMVKGHQGQQSNNLFNIKADNRWQGEKASVSTLEYEQGIAVKQRANFRVYDDIGQSFNDFVSFIANGERYQDAMKQAANPQAFIRSLQDAGYATDPKYADKVIQVMKTITRDFKDVLQGVKQ
ncbi:flagellar assembly peptidoglycan hydrolase FlgJ [Shewanella schlegeliana]|uniref:Peptidoglycan hydrolase FlgJ n=1 Tax=Shewanella schlegeliana TaxID=190308 RepID=A0ABS1SUI6_9GAMM|nr:flagellar assembly peptidoglycan hydrolase FlgJ [Shewanella schlegeliana]MBL4911569.1 flagellar assembly peptidoglycan hydrolase FlgJ [Shewanella schlegeliana]MCL1111746.1 flagellar assembly peptidoglycan hydrolase FlgJ [Shewanella schlegeliana]GIU36080.1 flagellar rod assembly protein/muramidase FlgJ [Shewanella schlegeliana]